MIVQSLSIVVPNKSCINSCKFCVAHMVNEDYENMITGRNLYYDLYEKDFRERLEFARDNGCNTIMLTGNSEPQQNWEFLKFFGTINSTLNNPFKIIEMQTTGTLIDNKYLYFLRHHVGVKTLSLSISSFDNDINMDYNGTPEKFKVDIKELCKSIKKYRFNLRISINLTDTFNKISVNYLFKYLKETLLADQVTFRVLYTSIHNCEQDKWIEEHKLNEDKLNEIRKFIKDNGTPLEKLEFGAIKYSLNEISTVLDEDCMSTDIKEKLKYLILRENCKLYSKWNDKGSLIF